MRDGDPYDFEDSDINYDPVAESYRLSFDPEQTPRPSMLVVSLIAHLTNRSPLSLPQFQSVVDTDSLDTWLSALPDHGSDLKITFTYADFHITVKKTGDIWAEPIDNTEGDTDKDDIS